MEVAVKVLNPDVLTIEARDKFTAEANWMAELAHHPNIVQVFRADVADDGRPYIVMEYYPRPDFGIRARTERFSVPDVLRTGIQVASAVETAHRAGILHRDIKPANILTDRYGNPGLTDFGIAVAGDQITDDPDGMSPPWSPPEVVFGTARPDERSDIYSLAATLWHLLVGRSPFELPGSDNSTLALMPRIKSSSPPQTGRGDVPASLERVLQTAMAKSAANRPGSAVELALALQAIEQEQHLPLTALILVDDAADRPAATNRPRDADDTRVRPLQTIEAQPVRTSDTTRNRSVVARDLITSVGDPRGKSPASSPAPQGRRARTPAPAAAALEGTIHVSRPIAEAEDRAGDTTSHRARHARWGIAAATAAIGLAATGVFVLSDGSTDPTASPSPEVTEPQSIPIASSPGTPLVRATRADARHVQFSWSGYANQKATDTFRWRQSGTGKPRQGVAAKPILRVTAPEGSQVCLTVQVVRSDGSAPSNASDVTCAQ
jgi:serine/threonine protein kinase